MHAFKPLLLLFSVVFVAMHALGQNLVNGQNPNNREPLSSNQTLAAYATASITKPSPGQFDYATKIKAWQTNGTGWGRSARISDEDPGRELRWGSLLRYSDKRDALCARPEARHRFHH